MVVGAGHQSNTPNLPAIKEITDPSFLARVLPGMQPGTRWYTMGSKISIAVSPPAVTDGVQWGWHLSISHKFRYPTWDEIAKARYALLPQEHDYVMHLPPPSDYVAIHANCFHLHEFSHAEVDRMTS